MGMSLTVANWLLFAAGVAARGLLVVPTRTEDANLLARFGESYRAYVGRTGGVLPRLRPPVSR